MRFWGGYGIAQSVSFTDGRSELVKKVLAWRRARFDHRKMRGYTLWPGRADMSHVSVLLLIVCAFLAFSAVTLIIAPILNEQPYLLFPNEVVVFVGLILVSALGALGLLWPGAWVGTDGSTLRVNRGIHRVTLRLEQIGASIVLCSPREEGSYEGTAIVLTSRGASVSIGVEHLFEDQSIYSRTTKNDPQVHLSLVAFLDLVSFLSNYGIELPASLVSEAEGQQARDIPYPFETALRGNGNQSSASNLSIAFDGSEVRIRDQSKRETIANAPIEELYASRSLKVGLSAVSRNTSTVQRRVAEGILQLVFPDGVYSGFAFSHSTAMPIT